MVRVRTALTGAAAVALIAALASCSGAGGVATTTASTSTSPAPLATIASPPSAEVAAKAPGAAALGDDPTTSPAGVPVDSVDWVTPDPATAKEVEGSPDNCHQDQQHAALVSCVMGDPDGDVDVAVIGDSKTRQWVPALAIAAKKLGWRLTVSTKSACAFTTAQTAIHGAAGSYTSCDTWNRALITKLAQDKPDIVINALYKMNARVTGTGGQNQPRTDMIEGVRNAVGELAATGAQVVLFDSSPIGTSSYTSCIRKHAAELTQCTTPRARALSPETTWDHASVQRVLSVAPSTYLVDLNDYICPASDCVPIIGNVLVYKDKHHLTVPYVKTMAPMMIRALKSLDLK